MKPGTIQTLTLSGGYGNVGLVTKFPEESVGDPSSSEPCRRQGAGPRAAHRACRKWGYSAALELIAHSHGDSDWNAFHAAIGNVPGTPLDVGQTVPSRCLKQAFMAEVTGVPHVAPRG